MQTDVSIESEQPTLGGGLPKSTRTALRSSRAATLMTTQIKKPLADTPVVADPTQEAVERLAELLPTEELEKALQGLAPDQIVGPGGLVTQLAGRAIETALGAELPSTWAIRRAGAAGRRGKPPKRRDSEGVAEWSNHHAERSAGGAGERAYPDRWGWRSVELARSSSRKSHADASSPMLSTAVRMLIASSIAPP